MINNPLQARYITRLYFRASLILLVLGLAACKPSGPKQLKLPEVTNSIGVTMVFLPGGTFMMGDDSESAKKPWRSSIPAHTVDVPPFQMGKTEVTVSQYKKFLSSIGREGEKKLNDTGFLKHNSVSDDAPVRYIDGQEIDDFIEWLNRVDGPGYRLPTESEWEYACRAGNRTDMYCGGNDIDPIGWHRENSGQKIHPVAKKRPNAFGLYDMSGNAEEWTADCWHQTYEGAPTDGSAREKGPKDSAQGRGLNRCKFIVVRGGSVEQWRNRATATYRDSRFPRALHSETGFRLARTN